MNAGEGKGIEARRPGQGAGLFESMLNDSKLNHQCCIDLAARENQANIKDDYSTMAGAKKTDPTRGFTPEELALLEAKQPELLARVREDEPFAEVAARSWLAAQRRGEEAPSSSCGDATDPTPAVQLPLWPEPTRAVPNGFLRSALFGAIKRGRRPYLERERLAALDGIEVTYTGPRLDQGDLDVWESILHIVRAHRMGHECRTTSYTILKTMGLKDTGDNRRILHTRIARLVANAVEIKHGRYLYMGSLLNHVFKDEDTQEWVINLDQNMLNLFAPDRFTLIQWSTRRALTGQPLAQWLQGFYASHAAPFPLRIETLYRPCGSEAGELKTFTQKLKKALEAVERASAAAGETFSWRIEGGLVYVERTPTATQRRHLEKGGT